MTYCVGIALQNGLVMLADTRTNAGVDDIATFQKMSVWEAPGERMIALCTSGNLAVSQAIVDLLDEGVANDEGHVETLWTVSSMFNAARLVSRAVRAVYSEHGPAMRAQDMQFSQSILLGGQIANGQVRLFQFYPPAITFARPRTRRFCKLASISTANRSSTEPSPMTCRWRTPCERPGVDGLDLAQ